MNWITKIIKAGEKIKLLYIKEQLKKILLIVIGHLVAKGPILKKDLEKTLGLPRL